MTMRGITSRLVRSPVRSISPTVNNRTDDQPTFSGFEFPKALHLVRQHTREQFDWPFFRVVTLQREQRTQAQFIEEAPNEDRRVHASPVTPVVPRADLGGDG